jgi:hypothetical protein
LDFDCGCAGAPTSWQGISTHAPSAARCSEWHCDGVDFSSGGWAFEFFASTGAVNMASAMNDPMMALTIRISMPPSRRQIISQPLAWPGMWMNFGRKRFKPVLLNALKTRNALSRI